LNRRGEPALEKHRQISPANLPQQRKVLHVARADLEHVGIARNQLDVARIHHFRYHAQSVAVAGIAQQLECFFTEALKRIRRRARFERATAQHVCAGSGDRARSRFELFRRLDAARTRADRDLVAAKRRTAAQPHDGSPGACVATDQAVRLRDVHSSLHLSRFDEPWTLHAPPTKQAGAAALYE